MQQHNLKSTLTDCYDCDWLNFGITGIPFRFRIGMRIEYVALTWDCVCMFVGFELESGGDQLGMIMLF